MAGSAASAYARSFDGGADVGGMGMGAGHHQDVGGGSSTSVASLYALCARVPLIKSPNVRVPPPIRMPETLHPLPANVQEYFVYPFSLERFVLDEAERREQARRQDLQRRAPGWNEGAAGVLQPTRKQEERSVSSPQQHQQAQAQQSQDAGTSSYNEIDEIAQMLDRLEHS